MEVERNQIAVDDGHSVQDGKLCKVTKFPEAVMFNELIKKISHLEKRVARIEEEWIHAHKGQAVFDVVFPSEVKK